MFAGSVFLRPGQELRNFDVFRAASAKTASGRVLRNADNGTLDAMQGKIGTVRAILAAAKPEEKERWRQLQHPVTHKIIQQGVPAFEIVPGDYFERGNKKYYVQTAPYNVGDINHWTIYYCDERSDL